MTKLTHRSRLGTRGINGKIRVRITRPWRGYKVGDVITPPGALRRELLRKEDHLGNKFAEVVPEAKPVEKLEATAAPKSKSTKSKSKE